MYKKLYEKINYSFKNENILDLVFTHKSSGEKNNERLEFLGDAILGAVISEELYNRFTNINDCLLYTSPSPRDISGSRMPSSA